VTPKWTPSTTKHGVTRKDAIHSILNASFTAVLSDQPRDSGQIRLFIGPRHPKSLPDDEIEVLVHEFPEEGNESVIFHVMPLGPKYRSFREEHQQ
jgi:hypothetical protein